MCGGTVPASLFIQKGGASWVLQGTRNPSERSQAWEALCRPGRSQETQETGVAGIRRTGRDRTELWRWKASVFIGLYRHEAERDQRSDDPFHCDLHEPAKEASASIALTFQLATIGSLERLRLR